MDAVEREYDYLIRRAEKNRELKLKGELEQRLEEYQVLEKGERESSVSALA